MSLAGWLRRVGCVVLVLVVSPSRTSATGSGFEPLSRPSEAQTLSPYFVVEGGDSRTERLPLLQTAVTVHVAGVIADVRVLQTYRNDGPDPIHARYVFPASTRAAVHGLSMTIGDQIVYAKIREKEQARREFTAAKHEGKNAALLEQQRPNVFTMEVANIVPGQRVDVELHYSELLVPTSGVYEFVYPTVVGPRYSRMSEAGPMSGGGGIAMPFQREGEAPTYTLELSGDIAAGMAIRDLTCSSHEIRTEPGDSSSVRFTLDPSERQGGNRDFVLRYRLDGDRIQSGLLLERGAKENFFLLTIQPPRRIPLEEIPPREYIFVVDVSGSMMGFPLETSKALLRDLIRHLRPTDRFNVLTFSGGSNLWSSRSLPATQQNVGLAIAALGEQGAGGGTELLAAVRRACELPTEDGPVSRSIVIVTDGYIDAEREVFEYIRGHLDRSNVFAFGIGSGVNRYLIEGIARAGLGEPFVVLGPGEARATAERFRSYIESPALTNVKVAYQGFDAYDVEPATIPDVMADRPIVIHGKWRGIPRGDVRVTGATGTGSFAQSFDPADAPVSDSSTALRYLWARTRVANLSDYAGAGENEDERRQIVALGLEYDLLTRYTSFIAVHETIRNPSGTAADVTQPLPLPAGVSNSAVGGMGMGPEPPLGLLALLLLVPLMWITRARRMTER
jgi:Ca-activated chloride channel family protein